MREYIEEWCLKAKELREHYDLDGSTKELHESEETVRRYVQQQGHDRIYKQLHTQLQGNRIRKLLATGSQG